MKTFRMFLVLCLTLGMLAAFPVSPVYASTITVSNCNDSGAGSLRQAVIDAVSGDTINFSVDCPAASPITLTSYIDIDKDLTISGVGHDIVLNGNHATRILLIQWGNTVTLEYLTLKNGFVLDNKGGGISDNGGYLTISHVAFDGNSATGIGADGGAIFHGNNGSLTILNSTFNGNSARYGGAIYPQVSTTVTDSAFTNNTANQGGAYTTATGGITSTFERVTMTGNTAIGPGNTYGVGGGIFLVDGNLNIYNSTFSGNGSASYTVYGGAIRADHAIVTIKNSTIVDNLVNESYGGGGLMTNSSTLSYFNSILANNTAGDCRTDEGLTVAQNTNNLVEVSIGCGTPALTSDPNLGPLADNGGVTQTRALLAGSPSIDAGDDASCLATDQRGIGRPQDGDNDGTSTCDIGAYELSNFAPTDISLSASSVTENLPAGTTVGTLTTTDPDAGDTHIYSFCGGADDASFSIAGDALNTAAVFDYETKNTYNICIRTDDGLGGTFDMSFTINVNDVPGLELLIPANGVTLLSNRPAFDWSDYPAAIGYNIQISKNVGFTQLVSNTNLTGATNSTYTPAANLLAKTNMWWRVRAKLTATTYTPWSEVRAFTTANPPPAPLLVAPVANALVTSPTIKLDWGNVTMPAGTVFQKYEVQMATDAAFTIGATLTNAAVSEYTPPALTPNTKYYWRVRAYNTLGQYGAWSASRYFRAALSAPNSLTPGTTVLPEEQLLTRRPTFTWDAVTGATGYTIQVSKNSTFTLLAATYTVRTATSQYTHTLDLAANTSYFWRVKANGANGPSLYSQVRMFRTANPPSVPTLSAPANNALMTTTTPLLNWNNSTVPAGTTFDKYEVEISRYNDFSAVAATINSFGVANSQGVAPALLNGTTYYWRVHSFNTGLDGIGGTADDEFSGWSLSRSFRVPYAAPALLLPANSATGMALKPTFTWNPILGATSYNLQVSKNDTFTLLVVNKTIYAPITTYIHTLNLIPNTPYYWRVRSNGAYGPGFWQFPIFSFTTTP